MADTLTPEQRSERMARIKAKDSKAEILVRSLVHRMGFRFRLHNSDLPGKPDIVLRKHGKVIFVHGCYWHQHGKCRPLAIPANNPDFWRKKFADNVERDRRAAKQLKATGWKVLVIWECETKTLSVLRNRLRRFLTHDA